MRPTVAIRAQVHPVVVVALDRCSNILLEVDEPASVAAVQGSTLPSVITSRRVYGDQNGSLRDAAPQPTAPAERCLAL